MSQYETLSLNVADGIAILTINRPEARNALSRQVIADLDSAFKALEQDEAVEGVILTGAGDKAFVAGADITELGNLSYEEAVSYSMNGQRVLRNIEEFRKPVLAAVNGFALGGGCELAMACHLRLASEKARFGQPEVNLGIIAGYGGTQRLPQLIGKTKANEMLLTGEPLSAEKALELGLVNGVYAATELMENAKSLLEKALTKSPLSLELTLNAVNAGFDSNKNGYEIEAVNFAKAVTSDDGKEGTAAFLEKRKPKFALREQQ